MAIRGPHAGSNGLYLDRIHVNMLVVTLLLELCKVLPLGDTR